MLLPLSAWLVGINDWDFHDTCVETWRAHSFGIRNINGK